MFTKEKLLKKIEEYRSDFVVLNPDIGHFSAADIFDEYFYEASEEMPVVGFNPQSGEHLRVGERIYYHPDKSQLVPERLRDYLREIKLED
ncbi:hypothetical protein [Sphingobacterium chungjuense]|uniref:hypothetical protein n=1 Tax=Sphingobacterium chungjuense TaxID=2675553 RepID=UPI00140C1718|nr:hypothetical protein [Sphingobacterium chungjuense]